MDFKSEIIRHAEQASLDAFLAASAACMLHVESGTIEATLCENICEHATELDRESLRWLLSSSNALYRKIA